jgi:glycosyltransferase involved in cell wall biosynthesis
MRAIRNVAVEAILAGRAVVASDVQGPREIIRDDATGLLVPAGDPGALAAAVSSLLVDWPRAMRLAEAAREGLVGRSGMRETMHNAKGWEEFWQPYSSTISPSFS